MALIGPDGLTAHAAVFTDAEIIQRCAEAHPEEPTLLRFRELAARITRLSGVEQLDTEQTPGLPARHSTGEIIGLEPRALHIADHGRDARARRRDRAARLAVRRAATDGAQRSIARRAHPLRAASAALRRAPRLLR
jgi:hypothetical protein